MHCSEILKGLPQWARNIEAEGDDEAEAKENGDGQEQAQAQGGGDEQKEEEEQGDDDDYDAVLKKEAIWKQNDQKQEEAPVEATN